MSRSIESKVVVDRVLVREVKKLQKFAAKKYDNRFYLEHVIYSPSDCCFKVTDAKALVQIKCDTYFIKSIGLFETDSDKNVYIISEDMLLFRDGDGGFPVTSRVIPLDCDLQFIDTVSTEGKLRVNNLSLFLNKSPIAVSYGYLDILPRGILYKAYKHNKSKSMIILKGDSKLGEITVVLMNIKVVGVNDEVCCVNDK